MTLPVRSLLILMAISEFTYISSICTAEKIRYLSVERPNLTYVNTKFIPFMNMTARRRGRLSPIYYHEMHFSTLMPLDNRLKVDFYFYEWLTNAYKPSFVEMHFQWCDLIQKDLFFGIALRQGNLSLPCPHTSGEYHLYNMTVPSASIPRQFPFTKGRIYCNITWVERKPKPVEWVGIGSVDMEIKIWNRKN